MTVQMLPDAAQETVTASVKAAVSDYSQEHCLYPELCELRPINATILEADGVQDVSD